MTQIFSLLEIEVPSAAKRNGACQKVSLAEHMNFMILSSYMHTDPLHKICCVQIVNDLRISFLISLR